jgi:Phage P22-like portal protein
LTIEDIGEPDDIVQRATELARNANDYWHEIYGKARDDLFFLSDEEGAQWDARAYKSRLDMGRPALTVDQLSQFINQVSNNIRANTPTINIVPNDNVATKDVAEIIKGMVKDIEYNSSADDAYDNAANSAIKCSIGFIRVDHDWMDNNSFNQRILIKRVVNPFSVLLEPNSIEPDGSDARWCFVIDELTEDEFRARYPDADPISFSADDTGSYDSYNKDSDCIKIAEFIEVVDAEITLGLRFDGGVEKVIEGQQYARTRKSVKKTVKRYMLSGAAVLERGEFPGEYLPLVPVYGEEAWEGSERKLNSLIRKAKDPQRLYNYWKTLEAEMLQRAPKAVAIAPGGTTEDFADDWKYPEKAAVLRYTAKQSPNGQFLPPPQITNPPPIPAGYVNAAVAASNDIKATMGLYNAFLGDRSNETSGVAIQARKIEGDNAVYHFGDNLVRSITQVGRVVVSMLMQLETSSKIVNIIGEDGEAKAVGINGALAEGQEQTYYITQGKYSVRVTTGGSFSTMRQEAAALLQDLVTRAPDMMPVIGDLLFKYQDFPGASAIADRLKRLLRPELQDSEQGQDPQVMALTQENEQLKGGIVELQAELQSKQSELQLKQQEIQLKYQESAASSENERAKNELELRSMLLEEQKLIADIQAKEQERLLKEQEIELKNKEVANNLLIERMRLKSAQNKQDEAAVEGDEEIQNYIEYGDVDPGQIPPKPETVAMLAAINGMTVALEELKRPKQIVRDEQGRVSGVI